MISEVANGIHMISLPFPRTRVKSINEIKLYVVRGGERNLLIDTGLNEPQYFELLMEDLRQLRIDMENTDIFLTHIHADHSGSLNRLKRDSNKVFAVKEEAEAANALCTDDYWRDRYRQYRAEGLPMSYETFIASHPGCEFFPEAPVDFAIIEDGGRIDVGGYSFCCIVTPGHSPAHTCLYDEKTGTLLGGDVILSDVAPILFFEEGMDNPLNEYLKSLDIIEKLNVKTLLPGHGEIRIDVYKRIAELRRHYGEKARQIIGLLKEYGPMNAWKTAEYTTRLELPRELSSLSDVSKWFLFLPACMTLKYLAAKGQIVAEQNDEGIFVYSV